MYGVESVNCLQDTDTKSSIEERMYHLHGWAVIISSRQSSPISLEDPKLNPTYTPDQSHRDSQISYRSANLYGWVCISIRESAVSRKNARVSMSYKYKM